MERQVHARAEAEWQHALDLEKKLKACSRWGAEAAPQPAPHQSPALLLFCCHAMLAAQLCFSLGGACQGMDSNSPMHSSRVELARDQPPP